jgi:GNAT superfamily N-acetyltransferase
MYNLGMLNADTTVSENIIVASLDEAGLSGQCDAPWVQFSALLDQAFALPQGHHYLEDFPVWSASLHSPSTEVMGAFAKGQLAASAALRVAEARTLHGEKLKVGVIGAVATQSHFRGQGLATQLITSLTQSAQKQGAKLAVLWSAERDFYGRLGFEPCGLQARAVLDDLVLIPPAEKTLKEAVYEGWTPPLFSLIQKRECGLLLEETDRPWYEGHQNVRWFFTGTPENPTAYAAVGRGIDLKGHIHEWGGAPQSLIQILAYLKRTSPNLVLLGHPALVRGLLGSEIPTQNIEEMCLAKNLTSTPLEALTRDSLWIWGLDAG